MRFVWIVLGVAVMVIALKADLNPMVALVLGGGFTLANIALDRIK